MSDDWEYTVEAGDPDAIDYVLAFLGLHAKEGFVLDFEQEEYNGEGLA